MGLRGKSVGNFRKKVDEVLREMFPALLVIGNVEVAASGPGGKTISDFMEGGEAENFNFPFRVARNVTPSGWTPTKGASLAWKISATETILLEIIQVAVHPWEDVFEFTARKRRV